MADHFDCSVITIRRLLAEAKRQMRIDWDRRGPTSCLYRLLFRPMEHSLEHSLEHSSQRGPYMSSEERMKRKASPPEKKPPEKEYNPRLAIKLYEQGMPWDMAKAAAYD
ncbi:MAG TPA: hypothetical protein VNH19_20805 [Candidatus Limnocylindrales bacterium]|nr:hypothetical protein [Candidatus Limnocylindrales bacterium]